MLSLHHSNQDNIMKRLIILLVLWDGLINCFCGAEETPDQNSISNNKTQPVSPFTSPIELERPNTPLVRFDGKKIGDSKYELLPGSSETSPYVFEDLQMCYGMKKK